MAITLAPYLGGKARLLDTLLSLMEQIPHQSYCEVFLGMGAVFLNKPRAPNNIINDWDGDIVRLWRCIQKHPDELIRIYNSLPISREVFYELRDSKAALMTDIERAARVMYLLKCGFGGKFEGATFAMLEQGLASKKESGIHAIQVVCRLLREVIIENRDWSEILTYYDAPGVLFYLDPPYYQTADYYTNSFSPDQYEKMRDILRDLKGAFVLSLDDCPQTREIFGEFDIVDKNFVYRVNGKTKKKKGDDKELIITRNLFLKKRLL